MGRAVDNLLSAIQRSGVDKGSAIAIAKSRGLIKQKGRHLVGVKRKRKVK